MVVTTVAWKWNAMVTCVEVNTTNAQVFPWKMGQKFQLKGFSLHANATIVPCRYTGWPENKYHFWK